MPEIRANLTTEIHRKLKAKAASGGVHLKQLITQILEEHARRMDGDKRKQGFHS